MTVDAIRARLGSLSPAKLASLPEVVQTLLLKDVPWLIECLADAEKYSKRDREALEKLYAYVDGLVRM